MSDARYSQPAIALHWLHAALVLGLLGLGWFMVDLPKGPERTVPFALHKSLGICALLLVLARALWRWRHAPPASVGAPWQRRLAALTHRLLYALLFLAPLAGYLSASFTKYPMKFFGLTIPKLGWPDEALNGTFNLVHEGAVWTLALLVCVHLFGALYHAWRRDGTWSRMSPWRRGRSL